MGQGYSMTALSAAAVTIDVLELADVAYEKTLASARFMKSVRARGAQGYVYVKAVQKPYATFDVRSYVNQITEERNALHHIPNALGFQRIVEVGNAGYLVRQYIFSSVYDRLSTRPFLEDIERKWLAFQLLCAVRDCHARNIYHGDIKTENLLVTSWNWLFLTDFSAAFKPTTLPEDNPADFFFYFDTTGRRTCYLAPERFTNASTENAPMELNWAMDIFSVGCTIAELFLEGPAFTLSQIFKYRSGEYNPEHTHLDKIEDPEIRAMILNMIELDPERRYSAEQHLSFYKGKIFPEYFYGFLHQYMQDLTEPAIENQPIRLENAILGESDNRIEKVYQDLDKISYLLESETAHTTSAKASRGKTSSTKSPASDAQAAAGEPAKGLHDGTLLFLTLVSSSLRSTAKASARLKACDLMVAFSKNLPDEAKLDRILPYVVGLLPDRSDMVKVAALHATTAILESVEVVSPINAYLFPEYIFPKLKFFLSSPQAEPTTLVRAAYASCLASLALSSARMLDMVQAIRADGRFPALSNEDWAPDASYHGLYDVARGELVPHFEEATTALITDPETSVRRALLGSIARLCVFFGSTKSSDVILSHLNTYLNDKDWMLRCSFFEALVGVALYVGNSSLERFILPIMMGSLTDPEAFVVEKVLRSLSRIATLGLFQKSTTWELASVASRFLVHPSFWIREAAVQFITQSTKYLSPADRYCIVLPMLQPFLRAPILDISEENVLDSLKPPLSKVVFEAAVHWASRKEKSLFWTAAGRDGVYALSDDVSIVGGSNAGKKPATRIPPSQRDKDDQTALETLRNLGMTIDDEVKLLALREYILRVAGRRGDEASTERPQAMNNIISLTQIGVTPQNVFFDQREPVREISRPQVRSRPARLERSHTLEDALLDASTTINDGVAGRPSRLRHTANSPTPTSSTPTDIDVSSSGEAHERVGSFDHRLSRVEGLKALSSERASSVSSRRSLLDPERFVTRGDPSGLRYRGGAMNLMSRIDTMKADAEISTTTETAFATLDGQTHRRGSSQPSTVVTTAEASNRNRTDSPSKRDTAYEANHSYTGNDPRVLKLLDHHLIENFPIDLFDFGQPRPSADTITPIRRINDGAGGNAAGSAIEGHNFHNEPWRPMGRLLTQFSEHTAAINKVVAAPDHAFFVTASDDGTCKVWDSTRLEKNITPRSRHTHRHAPGTKVKSLCFVEETHTFISGADDGSIHAVRVDYRSIDGGESSSRYGKFTLVRDYMIPAARVNPTGPVGDDEANSEYAVWLHHYRTATSQSILLAATNRNRILLIDLKNMEVVHSMENPASHGTPTTFCVDRRHHWLLLGTAHGMLDLWDLRFRLRLRSFGLGGAGVGKRIERVLVHPSKGHGRWVIVSCGGEVSIWDIEKMTCREVLRPSTSNIENGSSQNYDVWQPDEEGSQKILEQFARDMRVDETLIDPDLHRGGSHHAKDSKTGDASSRRSSSAPKKSTSTSTSPSMPGLFILTDYLANPSQPSNPNKTSILFSAGFDRTIRYWDLSHYDQSFIISSPLITMPGETDPKERVKVRYEQSWPTSLSVSGLIGLVEEKLGTREEGSTPRKRRGGAETPSTTKSGASAGGTGSSKTPRNSIISSASLQMLKTHMDGIMDVIVLKKPYGCVVSVDRGGCVYVFY